MRDSKKSYMNTIVVFLYLSFLLSPVVNCQNLEVAKNSKKCPKDRLKLGVCANLLNWLVGIHIGDPPTKPCCPVIQGLVDLEAAICLCTAIKANLLGIITIDLDLAVSLLLNACGRNIPSGFQCPMN